MVRRVVAGSILYPLSPWQMEIPRYYKNNIMGRRIGGGGGEGHIEVDKKLNNREHKKSFLCFVDLLPFS